MPSLFTTRDAKAGRIFVTSALQFVLAQAEQQTSHAVCVDTEAAIDSSQFLTNMAGWFSSLALPSRVLEQQATDVMTFTVLALAYVASVTSAAPMLTLSATVASELSRFIEEDAGSRAATEAESEKHTTQLCQLRDLLKAHAEDEERLEPVMFKQVPFNELTLMNLVRTVMLGFVKRLAIDTPPGKALAHNMHKFAMFCIDKSMTEADRYTAMVEEPLAMHALAVTQDVARDLRAMVGEVRLIGQSAMEKAQDAGARAMAAEQIAMAADDKVGAAAAQTSKKKTKSGGGKGEAKAETPVEATLKNLQTLVADISDQVGAVCVCCLCVLSVCVTLAPPAPLALPAASPVCHRPATPPSSDPGGHQGGAAGGPGHQRHGQAEGDAAAGGQAAHLGADHGRQGARPGPGPARRTRGAGRPAGLGARPGGQAARHRAGRPRGA